jgi:hypothetical protein
LDSEQHSVRLIRCREGTVLSRALDPVASSQTPYLGAFVAAELLAINRELDAVEARVTAPAPTSPSATPNVMPREPAPAPSQARPTDAGLAARIRGGAELTLWGAPFDHTVRPSLGFGLSLPGPLASSFWIELCAGLWGRAELTRAMEQLKLTRHDAQLRAGLQRSLGVLRLSGFFLLRGSLTSARYQADAPVSNTRFRTGLGVGVEADVPIVSGFALYTQAVLDVATSRSDYLVAGQSWVHDPATLLWVGLGLAVHL